VTGRFEGLRPYTADAVAVVQVASWFLPPSAGSPNADGIRTLYILIALIALVIFIGVEGLLVYSLVKYRARKGRVAAQIHGNTQLEIGWTVGAAAILIFLTVFTFVLLDDIKNPAASDIDLQGNQAAVPGAQLASTDQPAAPGDHLNIAVIGQQYSWNFSYPEIDKKRVYAYNDMYVPVGVTVTLDIKSVDVAHSWWIPPLGGKMDALPGYTNKNWFKIPADAIPEGQDRVVYEGQCAELCGRNHADMLARVIGLRFDDWKAWYDRKAQELQDAKDAAASERKKINAEEGQ
jgi:cytochrome c oxidase subunit 2